MNMSQNLGTVSKGALVTQFKGQGGHSTLETSAAPRSEGENRRKTGSEKLREREGSTKKKTTDGCARCRAAFSVRQGRRGTRRDENDDGQAGRSHTKKKNQGGGNSPQKASSREVRMEEEGT